jgi:hypothetical protein
VQAVNFRQFALQSARAALASLALLMVPLVLTLANPASRLRGGDGGGFDWMPGSFVVMGALLFALALGVQVALRLFERPAARLGAVAAMLGLALAIWAELAVDAVSKGLALVI